MAESYLKRYTGNYLFKDYDGVKEMVRGTTHIKSIRYDLAKINKIYLREPLEWNILTEAEISKPKYGFIHTDITADLDPPELICSID